MREGILSIIKKLFISAFFKIEKKKQLLSKKDKFLCFITAEKSELTFLFTFCVATEKEHVYRRKK